MKIVNKTRYETACLRAFVTRIAADELTPEQRKRAVITFVPAKCGRQGVIYCSGFANLGNKCTVRVPTKLTEAELAGWAVRCELCQCIAHEFHHNATKKHGRSIEINWRRSVRYGRPNTAEGLERQREYYGWAMDLPLRYKAKPAAKSTADLITKRAEHAAKMLAKHEASLKRAGKLVTKWRKKVRYYEKATAMAATRPPVKPRAPRVLAPEELLRKKIGTYIRKWIRDAAGSRKVEIKLFDDGRVTRGEDDAWGGDFTTLGDACKRAALGDELEVWVTTREGEAWGDYDLTIPATEAELDAAIAKL